jgi:hypothetical protein
MFYSTKSITIQDLNDLEVEADISGDEESVHFEGCTIGDKHRLTEAGMIEVMGRAKYEALMEGVAAWWFEEGLAEAREVDADDEADWRYECRRDEGAA